MVITDAAVSNLQSGGWLSQSLGKGQGTFLARLTGDGVQFYFRYTRPDGKRDTLRFGTYDRNGKEGRLTVKAARAEALRLSGLFLKHAHLREWLEEQARLEAESLRRERYQREHATLAALLHGYVELLEKQGKSSAPKVRRCLKLHVLDAWPDLSATKASDIARRDLTMVVARLVEAGKGREAAKLRSYLRAAFAAALRAEGDPTVPQALRDFNLDINPAADVAPLSQFNRTRHTVLSLPELRAVWRRLQGVTGATGSALRLCLLLGGQRPTQLLRIKSTDVDVHAGTVTLYDPKGRRSQPRLHVLPLTEQASIEIAPWMALHAGGFLLSSTEGRVPMRPESISNAFAKLTKQMLASGEITQEIRLADLRRTVETVLASKKITEVVRANLQSHGLGGVQKRHYDRHHYMPEKREALEVLSGLLEASEDSNVITFPQFAA